MAHKDNVSLLHHIASKIKTVRSVELDSTPDQPDSEPNRVSSSLLTIRRMSSSGQNLYALSELTQLIIRNKAARHSWSVSTYPGKVKMPKDIFHNLTDPAAVNKASSRARVLKSC